MKSASFLPENHGFLLPDGFQRLIGEIGALSPLDPGWEALLARFRSLETHLAFLPMPELAARWIFPLLESLGFVLFPNADRDPDFPDALLFLRASDRERHLKAGSIDEAYRLGVAVPVIACRFRQPFESVDDQPDSPAFGISPAFRFMAAARSEDTLGLLTDGLRWRLVLASDPDGWIELDTQPMWERRDRFGLGTAARWLAPARFEEVGKHSYRQWLARDARDRRDIMKAGHAWTLSAVALLMRGFRRSLKRHAPQRKALHGRRTAWGLARWSAFRLAEAPERSAPDVFRAAALDGDLNRTLRLEALPGEALQPTGVEVDMAAACLDRLSSLSYRRLRIVERLEFWDRVLAQPPIELEQPLCLEWSDRPLPLWVPPGEPPAGAPQLEPGDLGFASWLPLEGRDMERAARWRRVAQAQAEEWAAAIPFDAAGLEAARAQIAATKGIERRNALHQYGRKRLERLAAWTERSGFHWFCGTGLGLMALGDALAQRAIRERCFPFAVDAQPLRQADLLRTLFTRCLYGCDPDPVRIAIARQLTALRVDEPRPERLGLAVGHPLAGAHPSWIAESQPPAALFASRRAHQGSFVEFEFQDRIRAVLSDFHAMESLQERTPPSPGDESIRRRLSVLSRRFEQLADLWLLLQAGKGPSPADYEALVAALRSGEAEWEARIGPMAPLLEQAGWHGFLHIPLVFPERFFASGGVRPNAGFDRLWLFGAPLGEAEYLKKYFNKLYRHHKIHAKGLPAEGWNWLHAFRQRLTPGGRADWGINPDEITFFEALQAALGGPANAFRPFALEEFHRPDPVPSPDFQPKCRLLVFDEV